MPVILLLSIDQFLIKAIEKPSAIAYVRISFYVHLNVIASGYGLFN